ncbi:IPT/TIG domain-containing protein [Nonomuraea sp. NPDC059023]|uniref:IPT/TIG domain-containing protein n=1 Tax=unclassified Nonomuraea TaxID=2593643 RepID=UPI0036A2422A
MTLYAANGTTQLTKTAAQAKVASVPVTDPVVRVTEHLYVGHRNDGTAYPPDGRRLKFYAGQLVKQSELDACFPAGVITSFSVTSVPLAGGTLITLKGKNFTPTVAANAVTVGATNATEIKVIDEDTISFRAPAKTAGTYDVVVATDAGNVTATGALTYA